MPNFITKFERGHPERGRQWRGRQTNNNFPNKNFSSFERQYLENGARYVQSCYSLSTNRKLAPRLMTLDDLELLGGYKFEFSWNFALFRTFGRQQRL